MPVGTTLKMVNVASIIIIASNYLFLVRTILTIACASDIVRANGEEMAASGHDHIN